MNYYRCHQKNNSRLRLPLQIIGVGIFALIIFGAGLFYLRTNQNQNTVEPTTNAAYNPNNPKNPINPPPSLGYGGRGSSDNNTVLPKQTTTIKSLSSNLEVGTAERGIENNILYHTVSVTLPEINRETEFYEGWLVRQAPYDFFSTGEMVTNDDGDFVLEWAGEHSDITSYDHVVITREARDGNAAPSAHVAEGGFGD